jgi:hypothetical protein
LLIEPANHHLVSKEGESSISPKGKPKALWLPLLQYAIQRFMAIQKEVVGRTPAAKDSNQDAEVVTPDASRMCLGMLEPKILKTNIAHV